jgi:hypothetical protein
MLATLKALDFGSRLRSAYILNYDVCCATYMQYHESNADSNLVYIFYLSAHSQLDCQPY